ncbi:hypothetical protein CFE70_004192 [Pyrenophora teres f. teres 0-1]|uniref:Alpha/beta hydrolase fold-3 domain-containing protein n=1 Tax=Pyrenophora teres f. teres (strain 0-1) TaxID=861557 RepID=E3RWR1_PYRTT|nr:hypothetical protein PTT_13757 [Pyrenophora teres f. teres 0-1]KAE8833142.1 hypothetical protein HRS9139_04961 [Pyrenophora teres f. teres]KAE8841089.1 hypothetical protein PTNB85_04488 [Pyrenophora teres f. teres]KAE8848773.1 hypothetical protein HRS9122_02789 [Pyrenophora teres f. teres]KAE8864585.1 hypothetical protein PTNB29_04549 [Pyrenophora teres f. teres]
MAGGLQASNLIADGCTDISTVQFEEEFGERMNLQPPFTQMIEQFTKWGGIAASKYTFPAPDPSVKTEDTTTARGTKIRIYTPDGYTGDKPVCMYYHGGGWAMGDINAEDAFSRTMSKLGDIVVISVEYGLAPENKHADLMNECYQALRWALENSKKLNTTEGKFVVSGNSAGGQLAFATALRAIDDGLGNQLVGLVTLIPVTVHPDGVPHELRSKYTSMVEHDQHTINSANAMRGFWQAFGVSPTDQYGSPLLHPRLKGLKKVYLAVCGHDTLRDDGLLMKQKLDEAGCDTKMDFYEGYPHFFFGWPSPKLEEPTKQFFANVGQGIKFVLS